MTQKLLHRSLCAALLCGGLVLTGCSGGGNGDDSMSTPDPIRPTTPISGEIVLPTEAELPPEPPADLRDATIEGVVTNQLGLPIRTDVLRAIYYSENSDNTKKALIQGAQANQRAISNVDDPSQAEDNLKAIAQFRLCVYATFPDTAEGSNQAYEQLGALSRMMYASSDDRAKAISQVRQDDPRQAFTGTSRRTPESCNFTL